MRRHAAQHSRERHVLARFHRNGSLAPGNHEAHSANQDGQQPDRPEAPLLIQNHAERRGQRHSAICADPIQPDHLRRVLVSRAGNAPQRCSGRAQALAHSQGQPAQDQHREAEPVHLVQCRRAHQQRAADGAAGHAPQHRDLGSHVIGDAPRPWTAEQRGDVLDADCQPGKHCAVAHAQMHERRQDRQRQAYGNITDKCEVNVSGETPGPAPRGRPDRNRNIGSRGVRHKVERVR